MGRVEKEQGGGWRRRRWDEELSPAEKRAKTRRAEDWCERPVNQVPPALDFPSPSRCSPSQCLARRPGLFDPLIGWAPLVTERVGRRS